MEIRRATTADLPRILEIYNASILTTTTWSDRPQTLAERAAWFEERTNRADGVLVADEGADDEHGGGVEVVGFAAYGEFRDTSLWPGYRFTVESTVHVADGHQGRGVGRALMAALVDHAAARGLHVMVSAVDAENTASVDFHRSIGFVEVGRLPEIGRKFGRWLDLVLLQRSLPDGDDPDRDHLGRV